MIFVPGHISQYSSKLYFFTFLFCFEIILKLQKKIIVTLHKNSHVAFPNFWVDAFIFFFSYMQPETLFLLNYLGVSCIQYWMYLVP